MVVVALLLAGAVLAAVHHAEVVAHRVGEPFGSLVLAVAVTVIEVSLIVTLMLSGGDEACDPGPRDGVRGRDDHRQRHPRPVACCSARVASAPCASTPRAPVGTLATVATLATVCLVLPTVTESQPGPEFTSGQLAFAAVASLALYLAFVVTQTVRHRDFFLPVAAQRASPSTEDDHADPPTDPRRLHLARLPAALRWWRSSGLAKIESPAIEDGVLAVGLPVSFVGVVIALLVLLPETLAAANAARRDRIQTSLNLAMGSAMASIGLTIPTLAVASIWIPTPLHLGLGATQIVLLAITVVVAVLTVVPGRATRLQASVHLTLFAAFLFLAMSP